MDKDNQLDIWKPINEAKLPSSTLDPAVIVPYAHSLTDSQKQQLLNAMQNKSYDMATEFVWKKSMSRLRSILSKLGNEFIGEMIGRSDFDEYSNIDRFLNDYSTIQLAEQLNIISKTAASKLRNGLELINHYFSETANEENEEFQLEECISIIKSCVNYLLSQKDITIATKFGEFRKKLLSTVINEKDPQLDAICNSSVFFIRTTLVILINAIKDDDNAAKKENALANINTILPLVWEKIREDEKYLVGMAYRDVVSSGDQFATTGLRNALLLVKGFDYVPETLRSNTFIQAAKSLIDAHFDSDNFYNEPPLIKKLANLGTSIPPPAFSDCIKAYLYVFLGNFYNHAWNAQDDAIAQLKLISRPRWEHFFNKIFFQDENLIHKLAQQKPAGRFIKAFSDGIIPKDISVDNEKAFERIIEYVEKGDVRKINDMFSKLEESFK